MHLNNGADANSQDHLGNTPLHMAAAHGRKGAAEALLKAGASLDVENSEGHSPAKVAGDNARDEVVDLLSSGGPNP